MDSFCRRFSPLINVGSTLSVLQNQRSLTPDASGCAAWRVNPENCACSSSAVGRSYTRLPVKLLAATLSCQSRLPCPHCLANLVRNFAPQYGQEGASA